MALALSHHQASSKNKDIEHFTIANVKMDISLYQNTLQIY